MQSSPPTGPTKKGQVRLTPRRPTDSLSSLFGTGNGQTQNQKADRGTRIAADVKRALFFSAVLVFVGIVLYQFVSAL
jgi:hypothetical protein